jgi:hypothetical protein
LPVIFGNSEVMKRLYLHWVFKDGVRFELAKSLVQEHHRPTCRSRMFPHPQESSLSRAQAFIILQILTWHWQYSEFRWMLFTLVGVVDYVIMITTVLTVLPGILMSL